MKKWLFIMSITLLSSTIISCRNKSPDLVKDISDRLPQIDTLSLLRLEDNYPPNPTAEYYDEALRAHVTLTCIGKTKIEKDYWKFTNKKGYFSKYKYINDPELSGENIKKELFERGINNYYIVACVLFDKYIRYKKDDQYNDGDGLTLSENAKWDYYTYNAYNDKHWNYLTYFSLHEVERYQDIDTEIIKLIESKE